MFIVGIWNWGREERKRDLNEKEIKEIDGETRNTFVMGIKIRKDRY
jgi:hypothetical protein